MSFRAEVKKGRSSNGGRGGGQGVPLSPPLQPVAPLAVILAKPSRFQPSVSPFAQDWRVLAPLAALPPGAGPSWLTPGLGAHPSWLRAAGGPLWQRLGLVRGLCPRQQGWAGGGVFCDPREAFLFPTVPSRAGAGLGEGGVGSSSAPHFPLLEQMARQPPLPSPQQAACPFVFLRDFSHCQGPLFKQIKCNLCSEDSARCPVPASGFPCACPAPRPCGGTPPFIPASWPSTHISWPIWLRLHTLGEFHYLVAKVRQGAGGKGWLIYWLPRGLC